MSKITAREIIVGEVFIPLLLAMVNHDPGNQDDPITEGTLPQHEMELSSIDSVSENLETALANTDRDNLFDTISQVHQEIEEVERRWNPTGCDPDSKQINPALSRFTPLLEPLTRAFDTFRFIDFEQRSSGVSWLAAHVLWHLRAHGAKELVEQKFGITLEQIKELEPVPDDYVQSMVEEIPEQCLSGCKRIADIATRNCSALLSLKQAYYIWERWSALSGTDWLAITDDNEADVLAAVESYLAEVQ